MSVTGSIGVVGGKFNIAPLLNKWGITIDRAPKKNPAPAFSLFADFDAAHKKAIRENMHEVYEQFLRDVALGRRSSAEKIKPHAGGRVYSGQRAMTLGLTDAGGGIASALSALRETIGVRQNDPVELAILPAVRESLFNRSLLPFGLSRLASLADFSRPGIYALDTRFLIF
jgi:protease IV